MGVETCVCGIGSDMCSCGQASRIGQRNCHSCHARYMKGWRKTHTLTVEQRKKDNCRSYAGIYKRRGLLIEQPCEVCQEKAEMHHDNYDKPLDVRWLCREHHLEHHNMLNVEHGILSE